MPLATLCNTPHNLVSPLEQPHGPSEGDPKLRQKRRHLASLTPVGSPSGKTLFEGSAIMALLSGGPRKSNTPEDVSMHHALNNNLKNGYPLPCPSPSPRRSSPPATPMYPMDNNNTDQAIDLSEESERRKRRSPEKTRSPAPERYGSVDIFPVRPQNSPPGNSPPTFERLAETPSPKQLKIHETWSSSGSTSREGSLSGEEQQDGGEYTCPTCHATFSTENMLKKHRLKHTNGVRTYDCKFCNRRFYRKDQYIEHCGSHNRSLPFHCPVCKKGFQRHIAMRAHFQNEHIVHKPGENLYTCGICGVDETSGHNVLMHMVHSHHINADGLDSYPNPFSATENSQYRSPQSQSTSPVPSALLQSLKAEPRSSCSPQIADALEKVILGTAEEETVQAYFPHLSSSSASSSSSSSSTHSHSPAPIPPHFLTPKVENEQSPSPAFQPPSPSLQNISPPQVPRTEDQNGNHDFGDSSSNGSHSPPLSDEAGPRGASPRGSVSSRGGTSPPASMMTHLKSLLRDPPQQTPLGTAPIPIFPNAHPSNSTNPAHPHALALSFFHKLQPSFPCVFCGITFPDQTLYFLHKGCHSESDPWKCNICGENTHNMYDFNSHLLSKSHR